MIMLRRILLKVGKQWISYLAEKLPEIQKRQDHGVPSLFCVLLAK
jgi:hypothetical protein